MVSDANDPLEDLYWEYNSSIESPGGAYFNFNGDFDDTRELIITVDDDHLDVSFWEIFFFNISDPWGESTISCINLNYEGIVIQFFTK